MPAESLLFPAEHPAAVTFVPARGRVERTDLVRMTTTVALRRAEEDGFEPVHEWGSRGATYRHAGAFWRRLARGPSGEMPIPPDAFGRALTGGTGRASIQCAIRGTPLLAWGDLKAAGAPDDNSPAWLGDDLDLDAARRIVRDGRAAAVVALHRHMETDYRVTRDHVYRRRIPLADCTQGRPSVVDPGFRGPVWRSAGGLCASPATYVAVMRLAIARHAGTQDGPTIGPWLAAASDGSLDGEEHRAIANAWPGWIRRRVDHVVGQGHDRAVLDALRDLRPRLFAMEVDALTGTCGGDDPGEALRTMRDALALLGRTGLLAASPRPEPALQALRDVYLPSLPTPALCDEDALALGSLGPRP